MGSSPTVLKSHSATSQSCPPETSRSTPSEDGDEPAGPALSGDAGLLPAGLPRAAGGGWCALRMWHMAEREKCPFAQPDSFVGYASGDDHCCKVQQHGTDSTFNRPYVGL